MKPPTLSAGDTTNGINACWTAPVRGAMARRFLISRACAPLFIAIASRASGAEGRRALGNRAMLDENATPGELSSGGARLLAFLDGLPIEANWIAHNHIVWQTGQKNGPSDVGAESHTHCSAFTAAVALYLDIYLIRPPHHGQKFLSNAQVDWLNGLRFEGPTAAASGWRRLGAGGQRGVLDAAVASANAGKLVFAGYRQPDVGDPVTGKLRERSGHTVIVRPQIGTVSASKGPAVEMAGNQNWRMIPMASAFHSHAGAWPDHIELFVHDTDLETEFTPGG